MGHKNGPNIVSLSHSLEQLYSCILTVIYVKAKRRRMWIFFAYFLWGCVYRCVRENSQLCQVFVHSLITCLQLKKMSVMYESAHVAITFQLLEMSSITTPNQKQFRILAQGTFFKGFWGEISAILPICIIKKINLEVTFKRNHFGYWNSC